MITLFSTNCPRCRVLETKLNNADISYQIENDMTEVINAGFMTAPILKVNNQYYDFKTATEWINNSTICDDCRLD